MGLYQARDGDSILSDRMSLFLADPGLLKEYDADTAKVFLKNGLTKKAINILSTSVRQSSDPGYLDVLVSHLETQAIDRETIRKVYEIYEFLLQQNKTPSHVTTTRLAILHYHVGEFKLTREILKSIPPTSMHAAWKEFIIGTLAIKDGFKAAAANIFERLCFNNKLPLDLKNSACFTYGKVQAASNKFLQSREALDTIPGDSKLFSQALLEKVWTEWHQGLVSEVLDTSEQWQTVFPYSHELFEISRLRALALLQTGQFKPALNLYEELETIILYEIRTVDDLLTYYKKDMAQFVQHVEKSAAPIHYSTQLKSYLLGASQFQHMMLLQKHLRLLDLMLRELSNRVIRLKAYLATDKTFNNPDSMNRIQKGLVVFELLEKLKANILDKDVAHRSLSGKTYEMTKLESVKSDILALRDSYDDIIQHFGTTPLFLIGNKRKTYRDILAQANRVDKRLQRQSHRLMEIEAEMAGSNSSQANRQLLARLDSIIKQKPLDKRQPPKVQQIDALLEKIRKELALLQTPATMDVDQYRTEIRTLSKHLLKLTDQTNRLHIQVSREAERQIPPLLQAYKQALLDLKTNVSWGIVNSRHAYIGDLRTQMNETVRQKFDTLDKLSERFNTGYSQ